MSLSWIMDCSKALFRHSISSPLVFPCSQGNDAQPGSQPDLRKKPRRPVTSTLDVTRTGEMMRQLDIPLDKLFVSKLNARKDLKAGQEDSGIEELASIIRQQGLLSPPIGIGIGSGLDNCITNGKRACSVHKRCDSKNSMRQQLLSVQFWCGGPVGPRSSCSACSGL